MVTYLLRLEHSEISSCLLDIYKKKNINKCCVFRVSGKNNLDQKSMPGSIAAVSERQITVDEDLADDQVHFITQFLLMQIWRCQLGNSIPFLQGR